MDSITETMERIYALLDRHCPRLIERAGVVAETQVLQRREVDAPRKPHAALTREMAQALLRRGQGPTKVAELTGLPVGTIQKWSLELELRWPKGKRYGESKRKDQALFDRCAAALRARKLPCVVARDEGVPVCTVRKWARQLGVKFGPGRRKKSELEGVKTS